MAKEFKEATGKSTVTGRTRQPQQRDGLSSYVFGKVPPQAIPLEEAVLGAILLEKDALSQVLDVLQPDSFYLDAHQLIYKAMLRLFEFSKPVDLLTVVEELRKSGDLEAVGGPAYLATLSNKVASSANIEYHARIIGQKYIQRELINISTRTINDSFDDTADVFELLDRAENALFQIAERNMGRSVDRMGTLASKLLKQIEELKGQEDGLTGVPTGFTELDRLTNGFQPSDLIIVAARPGMGKTALTLSLARNAALDFKKGVAIFSLEMSSLQLAQRIISMEAEISGGKLRNGQLEDYEWQQLHTAIEKVAEAPIFIDDTPGINTFELRAKCRRLKLQYDIQLIIIDYLQLMSGSNDGSNKGGNREQEVSGISRSLKGLAKELNVPVIALSQLSRAVETRGGDKRPMLSDLRESGCLTGDTLLQNALTGELYRIKDLAERTTQESIPVLAVDEQLRLGAFTLTKAFYSGKKEVFELKTRTGRTIKASANHPFRKVDKWARLDELQLGDRIATPRVLPTFKPNAVLADNELILLAHLLGDGCILPKQPYHYTSADNDNIKVVEKACRALFAIEPRLVIQKNWSHLYLPSPYKLTHGKKHPITVWYEQLGIDRVRSYDKRIPSIVFQMDNEKIALFLRHLWATDGNISWLHSDGRKDSVAIYYATSSHTLALQVQHLLLKFGILPIIKEVPQKNYRKMYHVWVTDNTMKIAFLQKIGCHGSRGKQKEQFLNALSTIKSNTNIDTVPSEIWETAIKPNMGLKGVSQRDLAKKLGVAYAGSYFNGNLSRHRLSDIAHALECKELENHASSDVFWDEITSIRSLGIEDVYDATVPGVHNFVANNIIVHNSIEQDADMVAFIYRPEYYQIMEDEEGQSLKGIAEVIVAKHRHGALKNVRLRFTGDFARFTNLDDPDFSQLGAVIENPYNNIITRPSRMNEDEDIPF